MLLSRHLKFSLPLALGAVLAAAVAPIGAGAQQPGVYTAPPDVSAPPADAIKSPSGLTSRVIVAGAGSEKPAATDIVTLHYTGWTSDGELIDSSQTRGNAAMFPLDRTALPGWSECVQLMVVGEKRRCWIPEKLAYAGAKGRPKGTVVFDIELIDARPSPLIAPPDVQEPPADARKTASGLAYKVLRPGTGVRNPKPGERVVVHYTGWTTNGKMFDSSIPRGEAMTIGLNEVIPGWSEGLTLMVTGERTRFWIPENIAYKGQQNAPKGMLVFDVELIGIVN
jgi:FKBP-type peptidyl-prolyl cis-trans isomerase